MPEYKIRLNHPENAQKLADWIATRGGVAVWNSRDMSDIGYQSLTPRFNEHGEPYEKPIWKVGDAPDVIVTDPAEISVVTLKTVKTLKRIAVLLGSSGLRAKLTDASSKRVREACNKAGEKATYAFDYDDNDVRCCHIQVPDSEVSLVDYLKK